NDKGYRFFHWTRSADTYAIRSAPFARTAYQAPDWDDFSGGASNIPRLVDDSNADIGSALVDVNGDGFPDIIQGKEGSYNDVYIWSFKGTYPSASTGMSNLPNLIDSTGNDKGVRFGDFNGDGSEDSITSTPSGAALSINKQMEQAGRVRPL